MKTRRSPRNQERLWRQLGAQGAAPPPPPVDEVARIERILMNPDMTARTRRQYERSLATAKHRRLRDYCRDRDKR